MHNFNDDDDFVAVRRPKRKPCDSATTEPNSSVEKKRRKSDEKEGKFSDVDFVDRTILRNIRVPKKIKECDDPLQRIDLLSKEFSREVNDVISRHLKDTQALPYEIKACYLIQNRELQKKYAAKRSTLKGEAANHDNFGFCFFREFAAVRELAKSGVKIGNVGRSLLGKAENGVSLSQHADVVAQPNQLFGWIIICKYMKGRVNMVQLDEEPLEPQPGFECHAPVKNMQASGAFPAFNYSQIYLYEYSEDFDLMEFPSHVLPIAAVQIAAKVVNGSFRKKPSFEEKPRARPANPPSKSPADSILSRTILNPQSDTKPQPASARASATVELSCKVVSPRVRPVAATWGTPHSSGGFVAGSCVLQIPLSVKLEAETLIISFSKSGSSLPLGISTSRMTLNRFIDLEDLYTTIFRDGNVQLSLTREVHVPDVGYFSYYRIVLKDGCADKVSMMNFTNYLKATNKACLMVSHVQDTSVILFPDAPVARDIGLPQPDPMAQPFSLHCIILAPDSASVFYERLAGITRPSTVEMKEEHPSWQVVHMRHLRFSFQQQSEAQRACLLQQLDKSKSARSGRKFEYKPLSNIEVTPPNSASKETPRRSKPKEKEPYIPCKAAPYRPSMKEEEEDDIDDLAVLDSIDKMDLDEADAAKKESARRQKKEKVKEEDTHFKEVFREPPASPSADRATKLAAEKVSVVPVTSQEKQVPPSSINTVFSSMQTQIQSLVSTLQSQIGGVRQPRKTAIEERLESGETGPEEKAEPKSSKDWYWFYHKTQNPGEAGEEKANGASSRPSVPSSKAVPPHVEARGVSQPSRDSPSYPQPAPQRPEPMSVAQRPHQAPPQQPLPRPQRPPVMNHTYPQPQSTLRHPRPEEQVPPRHAFPQRRMGDAILATPAVPPRSHNFAPRAPRPPTNSLLGDPSAVRPKSLLGSPGERFRPGPSAAAQYGPQGPRQGRPPTGGSLLPTPNRPPRCEETNAMRDVDLRTLTIDRPSAHERPPTVLNSGQDVDMRRPPVSHPRASVYNPPVHRGHSRPMGRRISTYEPGLGFQ